MAILVHTGVVVSAAPDRIHYFDISLFGKHITSSDQTTDTMEN